jgi:hypothetical protein
MPTPPPRPVDPTGVFEDIAFFEDGTWYQMIYQGPGDWLRVTVIPSFAEPKRADQTYLNVHQVRWDEGSSSFTETKENVTVPGFNVDDINLFAAAPSAGSAQRRLEPTKVPLDSTLPLLFVTGLDRFEFPTRDNASGIDVSFFDRDTETGGWTGRGQLRFEELRWSALRDEENFRRGPWDSRGAIGEVLAAVLVEDNLIVMGRDDVTSDWHTLPPLPFDPWGSDEYGTSSFFITCGFHIVNQTILIVLYTDPTIEESGHRWQNSLMTTDEATLYLFDLVDGEWRILVDGFYLEAEDGGPARVGLASNFVLKENELFIARSFSEGTKQSGSQTSPSYVAIIEQSPGSILVYDIDRSTSLPVTEGTAGALVLADTVVATSPRLGEGEEKFATAFDVDGDHMFVYFALQQFGCEARCAGLPGSCSCDGVATSFDRREVDDRVYLHFRRSDFGVWFKNPAISLGGATEGVFPHLKVSVISDTNISVTETFKNVNEMLTWSLSPDSAYALFVPADEFGEGEGGGGTFSLETLFGEDNIMAIISSLVGVCCCAILVCVCMNRTTKDPTGGGRSAPGAKATSKPSADEESTVELKDV